MNSSFNTAWESNNQGVRIHDANASSYLFHCICALLVQARSLVQARTDFLEPALTCQMFCRNCSKTLQPRRQQSLAATMGAKTMEEMMMNNTGEAAAAEDLNILTHCIVFQIFMCRGLCRGSCLRTCMNSSCSLRTRQSQLHLRRPNCA